MIFKKELNVKSITIRTIYTAFLGEKIIKIGKSYIAQAYYHILQFQISFISKFLFFNFYVLIRFSQRKLRELDCCGHFWTIFISFRRRAMYKNIENIQNFKAQIMGFFLREL